MRLRVRRKKILNAIFKLLAAALIILLIYFCTKSKPQNPVIITKLESNTKIYIVENENEALSMWLNITEEEKESPSHGTLISISSHFTNGFYLTKKLKSEDYISYNKLINDMHNVDLQTVSSILSGFFEKFIWIYPMWLPDNNIFTMKTQMLGVNNNNICICNFPSNKSNSNITLCENIFPLYSSPIEEMNCQLISNQWETLTMQEIYAMLSLNQISLTSPTIVNINLDFFTVENYKIPLINNSVKEEIETFINSIFCINKISDELSIDSWFYRFVHESVLADSVDLRKYLELPKHCLCESQESSANTGIENLIVQLRKLNDSQLKELANIGICTSNKAHTLQLCNGYGHSNTSFLNTHSAIDMEFLLQLDKVVQILRDTVKKPYSISIIRSSRMGLVSHRNQYFLENILLSKLKSIYHLSSSDIVYHNKLLGGSDGWWPRHDNLSRNSRKSYRFTDQL